MKKLLLMAFAILTVSAFATEKNTITVQNQVEKTRVIPFTQATQKVEISLGESFMTAFGMTTKTADVVQDTTSGAVEGTTGGTTVAAPTVSTAVTAATVGAVSAAVNTAVVNANNSTTIVTPYGKY